MMMVVFNQQEQFALGVLHIIPEGDSLFEAWQGKCPTKH